ncbi:L,D-transpeptidase [uncultured Clostridium sp.]|uniref:L,D-transpeptidase family protein n=1 Tax=uncultured Clostridium sp. TaxID=59620 RepID=UPI0026F3DF25|nr:L,D-transpeptidase family protein [uncultured Clostridium sp.]
MNKKRLLFIGGLVLASTALTIAGLGINKYKVNKEYNIKLKAIEDKVSNGDYETALVDLEDFKSEEIGITYTNIITDFLAYRTMENSIKEAREYLDEYKSNYVDYIGNYPFEKLKEDISKEVDELDNKQKILDEKVTVVKTNIEEGKIQESKDLIKTLGEEFKFEDFTELNNLVTDKEKVIEETRKAEEEKKRLQEEKKKEKEEKEKKEEKVEQKEEAKPNKQPVDKPIDKPAPSQPLIAQTKASKNSSQLITVVGTGGSYAELKLWQKNGNGLWTEEGTVSARIGRNGLTDNKREGDGCTPTGIYGMGEAFGINSNPGTSLSYRKLDGSEYWVDDSNSPHYNTMQFGAPNGRWNSAEHLAGMGTAYNYSIVVDYNRYPVKAGKGSAIFLHVSTGSSTAGCIAVPQSMMVKILNWINGGSNPKIIITSSYDSLVKYY